MLFSKHALKNFSELAGGFYDVGTAESRSFEEVLQLAFIKFSYAEEAKIPIGYQFYTCSNPEKWMRGWRPEYPLERGVDRYLRYLKERMVAEMA